MYQKKEKRSTKQVQKQVQIKGFYLTVYKLIKEGLGPRDIQKNLKISKQRLQYYLDRLKEKGIIAKLGYGTWEVKKEVQTFSLGTRTEKPKTNLHALQINIPILKGKIKDNDWKVNEKLNNWIPKYKKLGNLGGIRLKNNNHKSVTIFADSRDITSLEEVDNLCFKIKAYVYEYMRLRGVILDVFNARVSNLNLATEDKNSQSMLRKGEKFELNLKKIAERIFPKDNINGKAWLDGSPFKFSAETNDKEWKREYLGMPFRILQMFTILESMTKGMYDLRQDVNYISKNYKSHVGMVEEGHKIFKKINAKLDGPPIKKIKDKQLGNWLD